MRLILLHNPNSGRANGSSSIHSVIETLISAGHTVEILISGPQLSTPELQQHLSRADALIVAGGDGSVHHAAPAAIATGTPLYHFPCGTENLFARDFRMSRSPDDLVETLRHGRTRTIDTAVCNGRAFVIMAGIGFDAAVVARVAANRTRGVTRADYLRHGVRELREWRVPPLTVCVDGRRVIHDQTGQLVVANLRSYAAHLNPAGTSQPDDGLLNIVFAPYTTRAGLAKRLIAIGSQTHFDHADITHVTGRSVHIDASDAAPPPPLQLDGECAPLDSHACTIEVRPASLRIFVPA